MGRTLGALIRTKKGQQKKKKTKILGINFEASIKEAVSTAVLGYSPLLLGIFSCFSAAGFSFK